jgi:hypothetical protein
MRWYADVHPHRPLQIDGPTNSLLLTMHLPSLPISTLTFHPSRTHILLTGSRPYLQILSLTTSTSARFPILPPSSPVPAPKSLAAVAFSPLGDILACAGGGGMVYLLAWSEGGPQGLIGTLKRPGGSGKGGNGVEGLYWAKGGEELWTMGGDGGEVTVWNVNQRRCVARWRDQSNGGPVGWGEWGARILAGSEVKGTTAIGCVPLPASSHLSNVTDSFPLQILDRHHLDVRPVAGDLARGRVACRQREASRPPQVVRHHHDADHDACLQPSPAVPHREPDDLPELADAAHAARPRHVCRLEPDERVPGNGQLEGPRPAIPRQAIRRPVMDVSINLRLAAARSES